MQAELVELLPYLLAFYALDAIAMVRRTHRLLVSAGGAFELVEDGLRLVGLWPTSEVVAVHVPLLHATESGIWYADPRREYSPAVPLPADLERIPWEELKDLRLEGKKLFAGSRLLAMVPTPRHGAILFDRLWRAREALQTERAKHLDAQVAQAFDVEAARTLRARQRPWVWAVRALCIGESVCVAALLPLLFPQAQSLTLPWVALFELALLSHVTSALTGALMLWRCGSRAGEVAGALAMGLLLPFQTLHALVHRSAGLYARFGLPAAAAALMRVPDFTHFARRELHRLQLRREAGGEPDLARALEREDRAWTRMLAARGMSRADALAAPAPRSPWSVRYCPLCASEYRDGATEPCGECGVPLRSFPKPTASCSTGSDSPGSR